ncbi:VOC family protein [Kineosporia succinea]|uniref:Enzyme related to lactoylglutathione lyase n=1 Tax=Kineosporia succinea TaxID=84632 RepID=A0ABT9PAZ3_9ACTN|nr:VOC family protein [Kineosporia succinea]MDP9829868.1 putative enzyme related to lactoylglutathione lyase [Kineosporia succinea]
MNSFTSLRIITADVARLVAFYELVADTRADWATDLFAEVRTPAARIALAGPPTLAPFGIEAVPASNRSVIIELRVDDVDAEFARITDHVDLVQAPRTMPWGNRSLLFRDPDGNLVNLFTPVTPEAVARFS